MYSSHIAEDQAQNLHLLREEADEAFDALSNTEALLSTLFSRINYGPDLDDNGLVAVNKLQSVASLLNVAIDLYAEAHEMIHANNS